jgi:hypothetical protein
MPTNEAIHFAIPEWNVCESLVSVNKQGDVASNRIFSSHIGFLALL